jgi:hypothetical protein
MVMNDIGIVGDVTYDKFEMGLDIIGRIFIGLGSGSVGALLGK